MPKGRAPAAVRRQQQHPTDRPPRATLRHSPPLALQVRSWAPPSCINSASVGRSLHAGPGRLQDAWEQDSLPSTTD